VAIDLIAAHERVYRSQGERIYELTATDVAYFHLDGMPRDEA
jgi:hypothetical protein